MHTVRKAARLAVYEDSTMTQKMPYVRPTSRTAQLRLRGCGIYAMRAASHGSGASL